MNELRQHKRSDKIKWAITFTAIILMAILIVGLCLQLFASDKYKPAEWFKKPEQDENTNAVISNGESNGIMLASARLLNSQYEENGISPQAESAYTLTATIEPDDAPDKSVTWSASWQNANSTFANGKTVTDYVTVTSTPNSALTATVECKQAFGEPVIITVVSNSNKEASATCKVDYIKRVTALSIGTSSTTDFVLGQANEIPYTPVYGTGTVNGEISISTMKLTFASEQMWDDLYSGMASYQHNQYGSRFDIEHSIIVDYKAIVTPFNFITDKTPQVPIEYCTDCQMAYNKFMYGVDHLSRGPGIYLFNIVLSYTYKYGEETISSGQSAEKAFYISRGSLTDYVLVNSVSLDNSSLVF